MTQEQVEDIYLTMLGQLLNSPWVDLVNNLYEEGSQCERLYGEMFDANVRLVARLGAIDEDEDVEIIINALLEIAKLQSYEMFRCGLELGKAHRAVTQCTVK